MLLDQFQETNKQEASKKIAPVPPKFPGLWPDRDIVIIVVGGSHIVSGKYRKAANSESLQLIPPLTGDLNKTFFGRRTASGCDD